MIPHRAFPAGLFVLASIVGCADITQLHMALSGQQSAHVSKPIRADERGQQEHVQVRVAAAAMLEGIRLYDSGDYQGAIVQLRRPEIQTADDVIQVEALKYTAFSYCVMDDYARCREAFDAALRIDPDFELRRSERGHPTWDPVFGQAKAASEKVRSYNSTDHEGERWRSNDAWRGR
jgi:tetratricopeptide (TPR) repeat protein